MQDAPLQFQAVEAIAPINAAVRNLRLYPPGSAMIQTSLDKAHRSISRLLERTDAVIYAEVEKTLIVDAQSLSEKELQKPQVRAFLETMLDLGIRSLTFCRGLASSEMQAFLTLLSRKPEEIESEGGLHDLVKRRNLPHILIDHKRFVALDKGQRIATASAADDAAAGVTDDAGRGSDRLARVLYSGIQPFADLAQGGSSADTQVVFDRLITELAGMNTAAATSAIDRAAAAAGGLEVDALALLLPKLLDIEAADPFYREVLEHLDDDKFRQVAAELQVGEASPAYRRMLQSPRGQRLLGAADVDPGRVRDRTARFAVLKSAVEDILQGSRSPLADSDVVQALPGAAQQLIAKNRSGTLDALLDKIGEAMMDPTAAIRSNATGAVASILQRLPEAEQARSVKRLLPRIGGLIEREDRSSPGIDTLFAQLKAVVQSHLRQRRYPAANRILEAFNRSAARPAAAEAMRNVVSSLIHSIADESLLQMLFDAYRDNPDDVREAILKTFGLLMPASADFLLHQLRTNESRSVRSQLMRLLPELGDGLRPEVLGQIARGGPWYYLRNLIGLLGKVGKAEDLPLLEGMLGHGDLRVQSEVLGSIYNIGDEGRKQILLNFLPSADASLKISIVAMLGALAHGPAVGALVDQLESQATSGGMLGEELAEKICGALGRISDPAAIPALENVLQKRGLFGRTPSQKVQAAARQALAQIRSAPRPAASDAAPPAGAVVAAQTDDGVKTTEAEIDRLSAAGDTDTAVQRLLALIGAEAKAKRFTEAERLRDKLYDIDAMALGPIIEAGEIIEAEKSQAVDSDHLKIFAALYTRLTEIERNALYHAMTGLVFSPATALIVQGRENDRLCFINQGEVKIVFHKENRETLVQWLAAGSLVGAESFFKATVATVSALSLGRVEASILGRADLEALAQGHPGLASKLKDYSLGMDTTAEMLRRKGMDRRIHKRIPLEGKVFVQLLQGPDRPVGRPFSGSLADFSVGGLSFYLRSAREDTARLLLGRQIQLRFALPAPSPVSQVNIQGAVIGANMLLGSEYSIHVRFQRPMDSAISTALTPHSGPAG